jgi:hypothetical protein
MQVTQVGTRTRHSTPRIVAYHLRFREGRILNRFCTYTQGGHDN